METEVINETLTESETLKTIYERRAVRKYKDRPVDKKIIEKILDAGRMAPSALNAQSWKFYIVTNKEIIHSFSKAITKIAAKEFIKAGRKKIIKSIINLFHFSHGLHFPKTTDHVFYEAPVVIFITAPKDNEWAAIDIGMCAQNMMLASKSLGLDSCPVGFGKYIKHTKLYPQLQIPSSEEIILSIIFGYGDENPEVHKRIKKNATFIE
ncbi:MAG: nitroreductase [Bacteroidota bacterium]|nr:nitroreductase [Bacteroidota bacterium]